MFYYDNYDYKYDRIKLTDEKMEEIDEVNKVKYMVEYEFLNDIGEWEHVKTRVNSLKYAQLIANKITKNDRTRNPIIKQL